MIGVDARGAWHELQARLRPFVARRVASPADADDVLQDVYLRMQKSVGQLRNDEHFGAWVYRVARSAIADHYRSRARHPVSGEPAGAGSVLWNEDDEAAREELSACVGAFVSMLPTPYREAITLTELQGMSQKDAARLLGLSHSGMKSRVQRGREQLRRLFEECCVIACDARGRIVSYEPRERCPTPGECRAPRRDD